MQLEKIDLLVIRGPKTVGDMAKLLGVSCKTWSRYEKRGEAPKSWVIALGRNNVSGA